jgi:hypothetical protein
MHQPSKFFTTPRNCPAFPSEQYFAAAAEAKPFFFQLLSTGSNMHPAFTYSHDSMVNGTSYSKRYFDTAP